MGFVLALISMLSLALVVILMPFFGTWMNVNGLVELDVFYTAFILIFVLATQALILFGFPLYYAQDQKSHMTGFRILIFTLMWMVILMLLIGFTFVQIKKQSMDNYSFDSFDPSDFEFQTVEEGSLEPDPSLE